MRLLKKTRYLLSAGILLNLLAGCGVAVTDNAKVEKVINEGLANNAPCFQLPIGTDVDKSKVSDSGAGLFNSALAKLKAKGFIADGNFETHNAWSGKKVVSGFVLTETGKQLVGKLPPSSPGYGQDGVCIRSGHKIVTSIEAVDIGNDASGKQVANVRATLHFVPEAWLADTKSAADWKSFWDPLNAAEPKKYMFQLTKSGSEFFWAGYGKQLQ